MSGATIEAVLHGLSGVLLIIIGALALTHPPILSIDHDLAVGLVGSGLTILGVKGATIPGALSARLGTKGPSTASSRGPSG